MEEGEQKLCLVEPTLELTEETLLQVQMQLLEKMEGGEALAAEEEAEALVEGVGLIQLPLLALVINQEQMQVLVEQGVMEAVVEQEGVEGRLLIALQGQEVQEVLAVLEEGVEAAEVLGRLQVLIQQEKMLVMVQQEVMVEVEGAAVIILIVQVKEILVAVALAALD